MQENPFLANHSRFPCTILVSFTGSAISARGVASSNSALTNESVGDVM